MSKKSGWSGRNGGGKEEEVWRGGEEEDEGGGGKEEGSGREMEGGDIKGLIGEVLDEILRFFAAGGVDDDEVWMLRRIRLEEIVMGMGSISRGSGASSSSIRGLLFAKDL